MLANHTSPMSCGGTRKPSPRAYMTHFSDVKEPLGATHVIGHPNDLHSPRSGPEPLPHHPTAITDSQLPLISVQSDPALLDNLPGADSTGPPYTIPVSDSEISATPPHSKTSAHTSSSCSSTSLDESDDDYFETIRYCYAAMNAELAGAWVVEADLNPGPFQEHLVQIIEREHENLDSRVEGWLKAYGGYNHETQTWTEIKKGHKDPIVNLMTDILDAFRQLEEMVGDAIIKKRQVVKTTHTAVASTDKDDTPEIPPKSAPDIAIFGTGPSATDGSDFPECPSYSEAASLWEVRAKARFTIIDHALVACYAREVFIHQPNRRFVYVSLMTGQVIRILRFDRAGCYHSQPIDFHKNAKFFVKLVILLGSLNEDLLGFDTSITWLGGQRVLKMRPPELFNPTTGAWEANTEDLAFTLAPQPVFARRTIRSRGTVCWDAEYKGQYYIIKDYWRADGRAYESAFLKKLAGIKGIGQMFAFDDDRETIKAGRGFEMGTEMLSSPKNICVLDRSFMRLVLRKYGDTLEKAPSARELLCAVHDIVAGHREALMEKDILHRDISFSNIRLSPYEPERGVVIDWDLAKEMSALLAGEVTDSDSRTGTRAYQSVKVLDGSPGLGHHDNMDDLESIFYVLCQVLYGFDAHGNLNPELGFLARWFDPATSPAALSENKTYFLQNGSRQTVTRYLGAEKKIMSKLVQDFSLCFKSRVNAVLATTHPDEPQSFPAYRKEAADDQYKTFLGILNPVIEQLPLISSVPVSAEPATIPFPVLLPGSTPPSPTGSAGSSKRRRIADDSDGNSRPTSKRLCNEKKDIDPAADDSKFR
ncbi:hypothetical protein B0H15DRAFT_806386 [Mycena belliarum]|uniref:Fungal-type protein kinase domain-containing protein n=1 Tax=Mycena belliarum TaxID=1033014 RepID=A0AAD6TTM3_9AGAR|nr:hypothetical protein B0H15DRAFT_806386 [Mycena belliae]